jgi:hypothetical protein
MSQSPRPLMTDLCTCGHPASSHHLGDGIDSCSCQECDVAGCSCTWYTRAKQTPTRPFLDRQSFEAEVQRLWPEASKLPLWQVRRHDRDAMYTVHVAMGLSPAAIVAGFADAYKSKALR